MRIITILLTCFIFNNCFGQALPDPGDDPLDNPDTTVQDVNLINYSAMDTQKVCSTHKQQLKGENNQTIIFLTDEDKVKRQER